MWSSDHAASAMLVLKMKSATGRTIAPMVPGSRMPAALDWAQIVPLILVWYGFSLLAICSGKLVLDSCPCAASLCAIQLGAAALGCQILAKCHDQRGQGPAPLETAEYGGVCAIAVGYSSGFALTNAAIENASPSFVETVKSSEPLSTVALAAAILGERERPLTLASLVPLVVGVAVASGLGEGHVSAAFSSVGMALALASNLSFSARAIYTKKLRHKHPSCAAVRSDLVLFYHVSRLGMNFLLPIAGVLDARALLHALLGFESGSSNSSSNRSSSSNSSGDGSSSGGRGRSDGTANDGSQPLAPHALLLLLIVNSASHALYNAISFAVLNRVSVASHAVLNIVRRVFMIGGTAVLFSTSISGYNWLGVAMCFGGCLAFAHGKSAPVPTSAAAARTLRNAARLHSV